MRKPSKIAIAFALCGVAWAVIVARTIFVEQPKRENTASQQELIAFAKNTLGGLQKRSFSQNREYCGLVFEDKAGNLSTSEIFAGSNSECAFSWQVPMDKYAIASFHTHAGFDTHYDSEAPSLIDLETDFDNRIDGFISTPGGRFWHIDWDSEMATQICGEKCLKQDVRYRPCRGFLPVEQYSLDELRERALSDNAMC